jgi:signal transduction histidine kinase
MGEYLHRIVGAAQRMDRLIVDLLEYSRLGRGTLELAPVSLDEVVREACALLGPTLEARRARVTVQRPLATVTGNRIALVQVVTNLFDNATKFSRTDQPPVVRVWTEPTPSGARLCVEDNGIGMDPSYLGGIFQVFHRLHASEAFPGTGIGLAIVRRATERMGGTVGVSSQTGQGSRFWVDMPVPDGQERHR